MKTNRFFDPDLYKVLSEIFSQERDYNAAAEVLVEKHLTTLARLRRESRATLEVYGMPPGLAGDIIEAVRVKEEEEAPPLPSAVPEVQKVWDNKDLIQFREILLQRLSNPSAAQQFCSEIGMPLYVVNWPEGKMLNLVHDLLQEFKARGLLDKAYSLAKVKWHVR